jgi:hypothetical protein
VPEDPAVTLKKLGMAGWELVSTLQETDDKCRIYILKREISLKYRERNE